MIDRLKYYAGSMDYINKKITYLIIYIIITIIIGNWF